MVSELSGAAMESQHSSTLQSSTTSSQFVVQTFSNPISIKLDEDNYLPWKQQAEATIEGFDLVKFITGEDIPRKYASTTDQENGIVTAYYRNWKKQDALVKSWLLASMSTQFTTRMVGCDFSYQMWKRLENFFASQIQAKVRPLKSKLSHIKKEGTVSD